MPERVVQTRSRKLRVLQAELQSNAAPEAEAPGAPAAPRFPPKPDWIRMKMPTGDTFFDLKRRVGGAGAAHRLRERVLPQHRRVLEPAVADHHDPGRHLHPVLSVLRRADGPARCPRSRRARARRDDAGRARAAPHRHHLRRSRRPARRRRRALGGDHPRGEAAQPRAGARGPDRRLQGRHRRGRRRARRRPRRLRAQPRDRAAAVAPGPGPGELRPVVRHPRATPRRRGAITKTGLMLGLGEELDEVRAGACASCATSASTS